MDENLRLMFAVAFFGLVSCGAGVWILLGQKRLEQICTAHVNGVVEGIQRNVSTTISPGTTKDSAGRRTTSVTYAPTFKYVVNGTEYIKTSSTSSSHVA